MPKTSDDEDYVDPMEEEEDDQEKTHNKEETTSKTSKRTNSSFSSNQRNSNKKKNISERRLKNYIKHDSKSKNKSSSVDINVGLTGARAGDILHGCGEDTANVILKIDSGGIVYAPSIVRRTVEDEVGHDNVLSSFAKHFGLSVAAAKLRYDDCPEADTPNHCPLGQGCSHGSNMCDCEPAARFIILNQGIWQHFASVHGNDEELEEMVREGRSVCYRDVLKLMHTAGQPGGKLLILRPRLFKIVAGPLEVKMDDARLKDPNTTFIDATRGLSEPSTADSEEATMTTESTCCYEMDGYFVKIPKSASSTVVNVNNAEEIITKSVSSLLDRKSVV